jgi:CRISPR-associated endonuclease/helicase Cas3
MRLPSAPKGTQGNADAVSYLLCPAKTYVTPSGEISVGRSVYQHCFIVGLVARELMARRRVVAVPGAETQAAEHDIGKVSPFFYEKIRQACTVPTDLVALPGINPALEQGWGGHATVGMVAARGMGMAGYGPAIIGQHHGFYPNAQNYTASAEIFGGPAWQEQRVQLVQALRRALNVHEPVVTDMWQARLLTGFTTVADWIGSGDFFEDPAADWEGVISQAVDEAGFHALSVRIGLEFEDLFGFPPNPVQQAFSASVTSPGVYVLEAPMGLGKTEAALYAAYQMLQTGQAEGVYFALPTQLTSNKIYERFQAFLAAILPDGQSRRALLLHGQAWLTDTRIGEDAQPGGSWFDHRKRGLLAPFAVGTLDQALMAVMNVNHGAVRAFGLAGKVVILDEIHSYDAYTGALLDTLVTALRQWGATVILLSATLTQDRRADILGTAVTQAAYPLITACPNDGPIREIPLPMPPVSRVTVASCTDDAFALEEALNHAAEGQQVLWVENTVTEAQQRFKSLAARARSQGIDCGLLHSRYLQSDRQTSEAEWVKTFGKDGRSQRSRCGRILIGTQVVEQSLDIDADFLVSRFAPTDMLLQRLGRLWRHRDTPRPVGAKCAALILVPQLPHAIETPAAAFGLTAAVYSPYVLCRSLEVWHDLREVCLPSDIRSLVGRTYAARTEQGPMARWIDELEHGTRTRKGRRALRQMARLTLVDDGPVQSDATARTRFSELETCDVLLVQTIRSVGAASICLLPDGSRVEIPHRLRAIGRQEWRQLAARLMMSVVRVPHHHAPCAVPVRALASHGLGQCFYLGMPDAPEALLRVAVIGDDGVLSALGGGPAHPDLRLRYDSDFGYRVEERE